MYDPPDELSCSRDDHVQQRKCIPQTWSLLPWLYMFHRQLLRSMGTRCQIFEWRLSAVRKGPKKSPWVSSSPCVLSVWSPSVFKASHASVNHKKRCKITPLFNSSFPSSLYMLTFTLSVYVNLIPTVSIYASFLAISLFLCLADYLSFYMISCPSCNLNHWIFAWVFVLNSV